MIRLPLAGLLVLCLACLCAPPNQGTLTPVAPASEAPPVAPPVPPPGPPKLTAADLTDARRVIEDYKANEIAADQKYHGKTLHLVGRVNGVRRVLGMIIVSVGTGAEFEFPELAVVMERSQEAETATLQKGDPVAITAVCGGMSMNVDFTEGVFIHKSDMDLPAKETATPAPTSGSAPTSTATSTAPAKAAPRESTGRTRAAPRAPRTRAAPAHRGGRDGH